MIDREMLEAIGQLLEPIKQDLAEIKQRTTKIEVTLENDIAKRLDALAEGQQSMNEKFRKLDDVAERVEDIQITVNAMEAVTKQNCTDIKQFRAVK
jgi:DNA repair ATPase RecN